MYQPNNKYPSEDDADEYLIDPKMVQYRDQFCRICLMNSKDSLIPIYAEIKKISLLEMFVQLTTFELEHNDAYPGFMCEQCVSKLTLAYNIRQEFITQTELLLKMTVEQRIMDYYKKCLGETDDPIDVKPVEIKEENVSAFAESTNESEVVTEEPVNIWNNNNTNFDDSDNYSVESLESIPMPKRRYKSVGKRGPNKKKAATVKKIKEIGEYKNQYSSNKCFICNREHETIEERDDHFREHIHLIPQECTECVINPNAQDDSSADPESGKPKRIVMKSVIQLNTHLMMHEMPHKCDQCYRRFMTPALLHHHMWNYHGNSKEGLTCEWCGKRYYSRRPFTEHTRRHRYALTERFKCPTCGRSFGTNALLRRHILVHTGEKNHKCTYCSRMFSRRCNLLDHLRLHTGERCHKCDECDQAFNTNVSLQRHKQMAHMPQTERDGRSRIDRNIYTLEADGSKMYRCKVQGCAFTSKSSTIMTQHRTRHNKPFVCEECGQRFVAPKFVRKHMEYMHSGKPRKRYQRSANSTKKDKDDGNILSEVEPTESNVSVKPKRRIQVLDNSWEKMKDDIIRTDLNAGELNVVREYVVEFVEDSKAFES